MDPISLQDRIARGLGAAARAVGESADAYRPSGPVTPLDAANRYLRLPAVFSAVRGGFDRSVTFGEALWHGVFDSAYTRPGDYLVQQAGTWFVVAQPPLMPVLCARANRTVSFLRPAAPNVSGANFYGGVTLATATPLLTDWPASLLGATGGAAPAAGLPSDTSAPYWTILLPASAAGVFLRTGDLMTDDLGRTATIAAAELTDLGWRIAARQATT
jgi:hypothetical protein